MTRLIAFYLPQFHPIAENDAWWGKGYTEWTAVAKARPRFFGHHQPRVPADLGFYDLRLEETRIAQADLARQYGIHGFCYYHYWFEGKRLLQRPFDEVLTSGTPSFPFCLCWANENWTRSWDGRSQHVLIEQSYSRQDSDAHISWLLNAFEDPRYIRVNGRPLFLIYRPDLIPLMAETLDRWRRRALARGLAGLYLCGVPNNFLRQTDAEILQLGFDAVVEFQPSTRHIPAAYLRDRLASKLKKVFNLAGAKVSRQALHNPWPRYLRHSYEALVEAAVEGLERPDRAQVIPCVFPSWDNTARRRDGARVIQNADPGVYGAWLRKAIAFAGRHEGDERLVFINAWNEWAEGCYLEPDMRHGRAFLEATLEALRAPGERVPDDAGQAPAAVTVRR